MILDDDSIDYNSAVEVGGEKGEETKRWKGGER